MDLLVIEDEKKLLNSISQGLKAQDHTVDIASDGMSGLNLALTKNYQVIISDIKMPKMNGYELVTELRKSGKKTPILLLTALDMIEDKINGFEVGADDYLTKPFDFRELNSRIKALARRNESIASHQTLLQFHDLIVDENTRTITRENKRIDLTPKEYDLLIYFMKNPGRIISKTELMSEVWDINFDPGTNVIEVYVNFLRNKIDKDFNEKYIHTQFRVGYQLRRLSE